MNYDLNFIIIVIILLGVMVVLELHGSGGHIFADVTDEQAKKADLGVGKCFLAPIGKLEEQKMQKYFCKKCESEFDGSPKIQIE